MPGRDQTQPVDPLPPQIGAQGDLAGEHKAAPDRPPIRPVGAPGPAVEAMRAE